MKDRAAVLVAGNYFGFLLMFIGDYFICFMENFFAYCATVCNDFGNAGWVIDFYSEFVIFLIDLDKS